ncbi:MAG TPA: DEAD/DEAH box helicase [Bacilli bacterium]
MLFNNNFSVSKLLILLNQSNEEAALHLNHYHGEEHIRFWQHAAKLLLELLVTQHFVPMIHTKELSTPDFYSSWDFLLEDPSVQLKIENLLSRMPTPDKVSFNENVSRQQNLHHFINSIGDRFIRESIDEIHLKKLMKDLNPRYIAPLKPTEHWLYTLLSPEPGQESASLEWLYDDVRLWRNDILLERNQSSYRTCLHLREPVNEEADDQNWILQFSLQALDDLDIFVPSEVVWLEKEEELHYMNCRFYGPQERLLKDLYKASRIFAPLKRCLSSVFPIQCELTNEEAYEFLKSSAAALKNMGLGVFVPGWWIRTKPVIGMKMNLTTKVNFDPHHPSETGLPSKLGFDSLLSYDWRLAIGDNDLSKEEFEHLVNLKRPLLQVKGKWMELSVLQTDKILHQLELNSRGSISVAEAVHLALNTRSSQDNEPVMDPTSSMPIVEVTADGEFGLFLERLKDGDTTPVLNQPHRFKGTLRPYQIKGFSWLIGMRHMSLGACLADDMGLGKTIQWIAYLLHLKQTNALTGTALLICPTSVLGNWQRELERFAPSLNIYLHYGIGRLNGPELDRQVSRHDILLTSYATAQRDDMYLSTILWDVITLDEAQNIKNTSTKQTQSIRKFKANHYIALTGTPVENRLSELWSILDFLNPDYLNSKEDFTRRFAVPIERNQDPELTVKLQKIVKPFILRRVKSDRSIIEDLPEKQEIKVFCSLTKEQVTLYEACVQDVFKKVEKARGMERRGIILAALTHLKQICNHPAHFLGDSRIMEGRSGKSVRLIEMLDEVLVQGERSLIFTQYAVMAELLTFHLEQRFTQKVFLMHGRVSKAKRDEMLLQFQEDPQAPKIFVLSLKTGGYGLNLTKANHVFHYDRWWNPAVENQATDRAYRIGQEKNVQVYKFICAGTLEERIDQMIESKQALAASVIGKGDEWLTELTTEELKDIFTLRNNLLIEADEDAATVGEV